MNKYPNLSLAIKKAFEAEADAFLAQLEPETDVTLSPKTERKLAKLVKRRDKSYYPLICTVGRRVAFVAAIIVVFAVSAMSIKPVRASVLGFFMENESEHVHIATENDVVHVSDTKMVECELTVPEGFTLDKEDIYNSFDRKSYKCKDKFIEYNQISADHYSANYDTEHSIMDSITDESGQSYITFEHGNSVSVIWKKDDYVYTIHSNLTKSEVLDLCQQIDYHDTTE